MINKRTSWKSQVFLHVLFCLYSLFSVCSKLGGQVEPFSLPFFAWYGVGFLLLGIYAIGWQQILKQMSLLQAFSGKAVVVLWGVFWGAVLFQEAVTVRKVIGAFVIMAGIVLYSFAEDHKEK